MIRTLNQRTASFLEGLRCRYRWWCIRRRRRRLLYAYADVGRARCGFGPGFLSLLYAYERLSREGLATLTEDGALIWHWPEEGGGPGA